MMNEYFINEIVKEVMNRIQDITIQERATKNSMYTPCQRAQLYKAKEYVL